MGTVHHLPLPAHGLTEDELDAMIEDKRRAQADAERLRAQAAAFRALQAAQQAARTARAARAAQTCPPCLGNCSQGDTCPKRLQRAVAADAREGGLPTSPRWLLLYAAILAASVLASAWFPQPWGGA